MFKQVDHIGVATRDIEAAIETLKKTGPVVIGAREVIEAYKLEAVMVKADGVPIELIQPMNEESNIHKFIEKKGEGLHHIAYRVPNCAEALDQCRGEGIKLIDETPRIGYAHAKVAFLHPKSMFSVLTELVEREPGKDEAPYELAE